MRFITGFAIICMSVILQGCLVSGQYSEAKEKAREAETKAQLHALQIALESFVLDTEGVYPADIDELLNSNVMGSMLSNPYKMTSSRSEPMQSIPYSETGSEGDFTYIPVESDGNLYGYYLIGYGRRPSPSIDLDENGTMDNVILVLDGYTHGITLPDIKDLL